VLRTVARTLPGVAAVVLATLILRAIEADLTVAALALLTIVIVTAPLGAVATATVSVLSYLSLNYWFTPHDESFRIQRADDFVALGAFVIVATVAAVTVIRIERLRRRAIAQQQAAAEARIAATVSRSRADFLAAMTHNLRTPIASIGAAAAALRSPTVPAETRTALVDSIRDEGDRLDRLVTKVLDLGRLRSGTVEPHFTEIDVAELVRGAVRRLRHLATDRDVRLAVAGAEVDAEVDAELIEVVVVSLLENALRFAPATTEILITVAPAPDDRVELQVVDHGRGVAPEHRAAIFDEFTRFEGNGSGVGLAIAAAFVTLHDGRLWYEDTPGGGATFAFQIPVRRQR
jgi:two-component system, OmpR family, sensor histidine kinase KdpD